MVDMSGGQLGSVEVEVKANLDKLVRGFATAKAQTQAHERDMRGIARSTQEATRSEEQLHATLMRLTGAYDKVHHANLRYHQDLIAIRRLERAAFIDATGAARLRQGAAEVRNAGTAVTGFGAAAGRAGLLVKGFIGLVGINMVRSLAGVVTESLRATAAIGDYARQVGLTAGELQKYRAIAKDFGLQQEDMDRAFKQLNETVSDAAAGLERPEKLFKLLGISIKDAAGQIRPTNDIFLELIDKLGQVGNTAERNAGLMLAFGDDVGGKMGKLVEAGTGKINELAQAVEDTGIVLSDEQIQKADETAKKLDQVKMVLNAKIASAVVDNAEAIGELADVLGRITEVAIQAMAALPRLFNWLADGLPAAVDAAKNAIPGLGLLISLIGGLQSLAGNTSVARLGEARRGSVTVPLDAPRPSTEDAIAGLWKNTKFGGGGGGISLADLLDRTGRDRKGRGGGRDVENVFDRELLREQETNLRLLRERSSNLAEINQIDKALIDINLRQRFEQIDQQAKRKALTAAQVTQLKLEAEANAQLEREAADRQMREEVIERQARVRDEMLSAEEAILSTSLALARTDAERTRLEAAILAVKQEQARLEIDKAIALAREANDLERIAELTDQRLKLMERQGIETQAFAKAHLTGLAKFTDELPRTVEEINEAIERIRFDHLMQKLQEAAGFAEDVGAAFGRAASQIANFQNPLDVLKGLLADLAQIFTRTFIEQPVTEWATRTIGGPMAGKLFGKQLTGPDALTTQQMNVALGLATQNLNMLASAAQYAAAAMGAQGGAGAGAGAAAAADQLAAGATSAGQAMQNQIPILGQFGTGLMAVLGALSGGGGGGGMGALLGIAGSLLGGLGGAGGIGGGTSTLSTLTGPLSLGLNASNYPTLFGPGFAKGGYTGGRRGRIAGAVHGEEFVFDADTTRAFRPVLEMIHAGALPSISALGGFLGGGDRHYHLGGVHISGARDDRSARRSGRQALAEIQRGLGHVTRTGMAK